MASGFTMTSTSIFGSMVSVLTDLQSFNILTYSPYVSWTMGGAGRYPAVGGAPLALWTPRPLEVGARLGGAPLGAAPRGTAACSGGTPPRLLTEDTNIRPGSDERAEIEISYFFLFWGKCDKNLWIVNGTNRYVCIVGTDQVTRNTSSLYTTCSDHLKALKYIITRIV